MSSRIPKTLDRAVARRCATVGAFLAAGWLLAASPSARQGPSVPATPPVTPGPRATAGAAAGYVPDADCATCHSELAASFREVGMARSFYRPAPERDVETLTGPGARFVHQPSGRVYEMERRGDELLFRRFEIGPDGEQINRFETAVDWILGSGNHSRTYLYRNPAGELHQLPIAWYSQGAHWGMAPGFDRPDHRGVLRRVHRECMFCHNAYPDAPAGSDDAAAADVYPAELPEGIGCQRCHGPGAEHVDLAAGGIGSPREIRRSIVNPARLDPVLRDDVCWQCHMQPSVAIAGVRRLGRGTWSYRPGTPLPDYLLHVEIEEHQRAGGDRFEINHHPYRLRQSRCWTESARRLSCLTCHDPHRKVPASERAAHYRTACLTCHETADCGVGHATGLPADVAGVDRLDCVSCHMPKRRTQDVVQVVMTDHRIRRRPGGPELLAPIEERDPVPESVGFLEPDRLAAGVPRGLYLSLALVQTAGGLLRYALDDLASSLSQARSQPEVVRTGNDARIVLATGLLKARDWDAAAPVLEEILAKRPETPLAWELLGIARAGQGRRAEAIELVGRAAASPQARPETFNNLGLLLLGTGQVADAEAAFERAVTLRPTFADAWNQLGRVRARRGEIETAIAAHRRALTIEPRFPRPYLDLSEILVAEGRPEEARRWLRHGVEVATVPAPLAAALARLEEGSEPGDRP